MNSGIVVSPFFWLLAVILQTACPMQSIANPLEVEYDKQLQSFINFDRSIPRRDGLGAEILTMESDGIVARLGFIKNGGSYELELAVIERNIDRDPKNIAVQTIEIDESLYESVVSVIESAMELPRLPFGIRHFPLGGSWHRYSLRDPRNAFHTTSPKGAFLRNLDSLAGRILRWVDTDDQLDKRILHHQICSEAELLATEAFLRSKGDPFH